MKQIVRYTVTVLVILAGSFVFTAGTLAAEVVIKQVPMTWNDVAGKNGHEMYDQLCAVCHGMEGKGDGPAARALSQPVPDLTQIGTGATSKYSHAQLKRVIAGKSRAVHQDLVGMPLWETEFQYVHRSWNGQPRTTYARVKINSLAEYVEGLTLAATD
jgi:mono/diheme cytochrome c family protein